MTGVALILCACRRPPKSIQKALKNRSNMGPKSMKNRYWKPPKSVFRFGRLFESLQIDFFMILDTNMAPTGSQNGAQNRSKIDPEASWSLGRVPRCSKYPLGPHFGWFSDRFSIVFSINFGRLLACFTFTFSA